MSDAAHDGKPRRNSIATRVNRAVVARRRRHILRLVESLPETTVTVAGDRHLSLEVRGKRFGYYLDDHHGDGRVALNCKAEPGAGQTLAAFAPDRFYVPAYVGPRGWIGLWIDLPNIDWDEVWSIILDAYCLTASKQLVRQLRHDVLTRTTGKPGSASPQSSPEP